jgi:hypothetical protein
MSRIERVVLLICVALLALALAVALSVPRTG